MADRRPVRIAILDSGVNTDHPHIKGQGEIEIGPTIDERGVVVDALATDTIGHGTAVAAAILDLAPGSEIYTIKVFGGRLDCPFEHVLLGLEQAVAWRPDLINLSLGTTVATYSGQLEELLRSHLDRGLRVVAPASVSGLPSYPGALLGVDRVVEDQGRPREEPEQRESGGREYWFASPYPRDLPGLPRKMNLMGSSMATANVTGHLAARWR